MGKKIIWLIVLGGFLISLTVVIWLYLPREVDVRLEGVKYRLGTENALEVQPATILIEGTVRRTLKGHRLFQGTVEIEGEPMPVPKEVMKRDTFSARKEAGFTLIYYWFENGKIGKDFPLGQLYANDDFSQIALTRFEQREDGSWNWSGGDGLMLTAPAKDRAEALRLANKLMVDLLQGLEPLK